MALSLPIFTVDAFTNSRFRGNAAAICPLEVDSASPTDSLQQRIAFEMNISETAFVKPLDGRTLANGERFGLRWFTPTTEVPLCGHATLAAAHVLFNELHNDRAAVHFETLSGRLSCSRAPNGRIAMTFPQYQICDVGSDELAQPPPFLNELVKATVGDLKLANLAYAPLAKNLLVHLDCTKGEFESLSPDFERLAAADPSGDYVKGIIASVNGRTAAYDGFDCASRYFAPWYGVKEDPATGSAHCVIGPYWSKQLGKKNIKAYQYFPSRGAEFELDLLENNQIRLTGAAVTVIRGTLDVENDS